VPPNSQVENIPSAKKLSSNPTNAEAVEGTSLITETWDLFHSPEEFVAKAVTTGHPHGMKQCFREVLKGAITTNMKELSIAQRARKRTLKIKQWMAWAEELAQEEKELKASMHVDVKAILAQKKIKLWERLLCDVNYADMGVAQEFIQGISLVGEVEQCGLWPAKISPALITESELLEISERDKTAVLERVASSSNPVTDEAVWEKTMAEVGLRVHCLQQMCPITVRLAEGSEWSRDKKCGVSMNTPDHQLTYRCKLPNYQNPILWMFLHH